MAIGGDYYGLYLGFGRLPDFKCTNTRQIPEIRLLANLARVGGWMLKRLVDWARG